MTIRATRRLGQEAAGVATARTPTHAHLRERLLAILTATVAIDLVGSVLIYMFEHDAKGTAIHGYFDALFWTSAQLLTISSQMSTPITTGGRITDIFLMFWGLSVLTTVAGAFGAFFFRRGAERDPIRVASGD